MEYPSDGALMPAQNWSSFERSNSHDGSLPLDGSPGLKTDGYSGLMPASDM